MFSVDLSCELLCVAMADAGSVETVSKTKQRHKRENRMLQAKLKQLKRNKDLSKDALASKTDEMQAEQQARHSAELEAAEAAEAAGTVGTAVDSSIAEAPVHEDGSTPTPNEDTPATPTSASAAAADSEVDVPGDWSKMSKAARKKAQKKAADAKKRDAMRAEAAAAAAAMGDVKQVETDTLIAQLAKEGGRLVKVPADGNCLFSAVADQLSSAGPTGQGMLRDAHASVSGSPQTLDDAGHDIDISASQALRLLATQYIALHSADFAAFLTDAAGDVTDVGAYCADMGDIRKGKWGGQPELLALSKALNTPLRVVQVDDVMQATPSRPSLLRSMVFGEEQQGPQLTVAFHKHYYALGEHYNSVRYGGTGGEAVQGSATKASGLMGDAQ